MPHPFQHNGTSQIDRLAKSLMPNSFKLDGRSFQDIVAATHRYAQLLHFYEETNKPEGDWRAFWESDALALLAIIASMDLEAIQRGYADLEVAFAQDFDRFMDENDFTCTEDPSDQYKLKFIAYILEQATTIEKYRCQLPENHAFYHEVVAMIDKANQRDFEELETSFARLIRAHKAADAQLDPEVYTKRFLGNFWGVPDLSAYYKLLPLPNFHFDALRDLFLVFYQTLVRMRLRAQFWFDQEIAEPQTQQPHVALYLAFLHLFRHNQADLNGLTSKHLNYYYEQILQIQRRPEVSDEVHLIFELAKDFDRYLLDKGTGLLAGKDAAGKVLVFETVENWVVNKAKVVLLQSVNTEGVGVMVDGEEIKFINATSVANSEDGLGQSFGDGQVQWRAFADTDYIKNTEGGYLGFAIASPQLVLKEGTRKIIITADVTNLDFESEAVELDQTTTVKPEAINMKGGVIIRLSLEKELKSFDCTRFDLVAIETKDKPVKYYVNQRKLTLEIELDPNTPPIVAPQKSDEKEPVVSRELPQLLVTYAKKNIHYLLKNAKIKDIAIEVQVKGVKKGLILQNDFGLFDGTKRLLPFGAEPKKGAKFYVGSPEIFQKALYYFNLKFEWVSPPDFSTTYANYLKAIDPRISIKHLSTNQFSPQSNNSIPNVANFTSSSKGLEFAFTLPMPRKDSDDVKFEINFFDAFTGYGKPNSLQDLYLDRLTIAVKCFGEPNKKEGDNSKTPLPPVERIANVDVTNGSYQFSLLDLLDDADLNFKTITKVTVENTSFTYFEPTQKYWIKKDIEPNKHGLLIFNNDIRPLLEGNRIIEFLETKLRNDENRLEKNLFGGRSKKFDSFERFEADLTKGFLRIQLADIFGTTDFLHEQYRKILFAIAAEKLIEGSVTVPTSIPNEPYTPAFNGISADYNSVQKFEFASDEFYYLMPNDGYKKYIPKNAELTFLIVENTTPSLYIGLQNLNPNDTLALLVQTLEGTESQPEATKPTIEWSYLTENNKWETFPPQNLFKDTTDGLTRTGILQFLVPSDISSVGNTILDKNLLWIKAEAKITEGGKIIATTEALPDLVSIRAQAVQARFVNRGNDLAHLATPLPPATISKLLVGNSAVKKVEQPFASFDGRLPELAGEEFYRRVSERLRHRDRAVTAWDFERLVLEKFPKIARARCFAHTAKDNLGNDKTSSNGSVMVAVVPDLRRPNSVLRSEPRFNAADLNSMADYLRGKTSLFIAQKGVTSSDPSFLQVVNPFYESIHITLNATIKKGEDVNQRQYYINEALRRFIAPWTYDPTADIVFGRTIPQSSLVALIDNLPFVEHINVFEIRYKKADGMLHVTAIDTPSVIPDSPRGILTTVDKHEVTCVLKN